MSHNEAPKLRARYSSRDQSPWAGRAAIGLGWGYFQGNIGDNQPHQHHAMQIVVARNTLHIWFDDAGWREFCGVIIGPGVLHQLSDADEAMRMLYLGPESDQARRISSRMRNGWQELSRAESSELWERFEHSNLHDLKLAAADLLCLGTNGSGELPSDALMQRLLHELPHPLPDRMTVRQLAQRVHLSPSRFQHRFVRHTGMAVRPYLRWLRLLTALTALARKASLTQAAVEAGFADAAHFSRTFRRHFGFAPRHLLRMLLIDGEPE